MAKKPELLSPAGSVAAFDAAIDAGADAIYLGLPSFNARINAQNFTPADIGAAISRAHAYGVKVYVTLNTLVYDKEIDDLLRTAEVDRPADHAPAVGAVAGNIHIKILMLRHKFQPLLRVHILFAPGFAGMCHHNFQIGASLQNRQQFPPGPVVDARQHVQFFHLLENGDHAR